MISPKKGKPQSWQEILRVIGRCPVCGAIYNIQKTKLFAQQEETNFVHFSCDSCGGNFIAMVTTLSHGLSTIGLVSDLDFEDAQKKFLFPPITMDEVISYHQQIINNNFLNS